MDVSRKRPHTDNDIPPISAKKRALTGANGSPVNGDTEPDEDPFGEKLEVTTVFALCEAPVLTLASQMFRKEAIYRRMKHYCREHERSKARIQELERRKNTCEAGLAAMSACWAQVGNLDPLLNSLVLCATVTRRLLTIIRLLCRSIARRYHKAYRQAQRCSSSEAGKCRCVRILNIGRCM
jgi:hypothetical protein